MDHSGLSYGVKWQYKLYHLLYFLLTHKQIELYLHLHNIIIALPLSENDKNILCRCSLSNSGSDIIGSDLSLLSHPVYANFLDLSQLGNIWVALLVTIIHCFNYISIVLTPC